MPLRLRGSYATERHAFSYFSSSPTLDLLAAVAARVPSSKSHIPFISTPAQAFISGVGVPPQSNHQADNLTKLRQEFLSVIELIAKDFRRG